MNVRIHCATPARFVLVLCAMVATVPNIAVAEGVVVSPEVIVAGRYVTPDGTIEKGVTFSISNGKIQQVGSGEPASNANNVVRYESGVVCPGLIDIRSSMGAYGNTAESAFSIDPGVSAIDAFDRDHRDFRVALESGITSALIAPAPVNIVAGVCAVVKTGGGSRGRAGTVLRDDGPLVFGFGPATWKYDRAPTSRIGAMGMARRAIDDAKRGNGHARMQAFVSGDLDTMLFCSAPMDVSAAIRLLGDLTKNASIVHTSDVLDLAEEVTGAKSSLIVGPYTYQTSQRTLALAGALASAGGRVVFAGRMPIEGGQSLRQTAALAVRYGMDAAKARQAMTINAAVAAGVADRVGAIRGGMDADFVVFSGDPLRMDSRVLTVYIDGKRVYSADPQIVSARRQR